MTDTRPDQRTRRPGRWIIGPVLLVILAVVVTVLIVTGRDDGGAEAQDAQDAQADSRDTLDTLDSERIPDEIDRIVEEVSRSYDASLGVSLKSDGEVLHAGELQEVRAWSTTKVPVAIAAQQHAEDNGTTGYIADDITAAMTMSDNDAAMRLFTSLGSWQQGSAALTEVLKETGDPTDAVAAESEPDYTGFGDIHWTLDDQVTFADRMACLDGSEPVLDEMGQVIAVHRMGLGVLPGARFKGGWGPENDGTYVLREFGLVGEKDRQVPVAIAVVPDDGLDSTAREAAQALAEALEPVLEAAADNGGTAECQVPASVPDASDEEPVSAEEYMMMQ
jgi:hypothetical protein